MDGYGMATGELTDEQVLSGQRELTDAEVMAASRPATMNQKFASQGARFEGAQEAARAVSDKLSGRDEGIDYKSGIKNAAFRAGFSRMTNDAEKANYLNLKIGLDKWGKDSSGAYYIKPEGLRTFGMQSTMPVSIDEQSASLYDIADIVGDLPAIAGSIALPVAATGVGVPAALALAGLGAAGGKAFDELIKNIQGLQVKSAGDVAKDLGAEAGMAAVGEGAARVLGAAGKFALGPGASRMTPEKAALAKDTLSQGFGVRPGAVTDAPILARWEGMVRNIFGDIHAQKNKVAAEAGLTRLAGAGRQVGKQEAGEAISTSLKAERVKFGADMGQKYAAIDSLVGDTPIIPTRPIKDAAEALLANLPKTADGKVIGGRDAFVKDILQMEDAITVAQAQRLRTLLREASESVNLVPDVAKHEAKVLRRTVDDAFDLAKNSKDPAIEKAVKLLRQTDSEYKFGIKKFDNPIVSAITRDASRSGAVDADMVVDYLIKPERLVRLRQVKGTVPAQEWAKVQSAHSQELLSSVVKGTNDPLVSVFNGRAFRDTLDKYGRAVLEEVHGKQWSDQAYKYANALMLAEKQMSLSGGIVAANIALHPVRNLPKLVWLRALAQVMEQPGTFKYLTEGIKVGQPTEKTLSVVNRLLNQIAANARDETGSATITIPEQ